MGDQIRVENGIWGYGTNVYIVGQENASLLLMDWDENGTLLWNSTWGGAGSEFNTTSYYNADGTGVWGDGKYVYTCGSSINPSEDTRYFAEYFCLIKWDLSGNEVWNVTWFVNQFGGKPEFQSNLWSQDNDIYICYTFIGFNSWDYSLIKCDNTVNVIWNQTLESDNWYYVGNGIWGDGTNIYTVNHKRLC